MSISLRRRIYPRGGSFETTIPIQILFGIDLNEKNDIIFEYDKKNKKWYIRFEKSKNEK
ncbi:MAG: hypothetical protein QXK76_04155 [Candidatus Woesearchaeota archaeon]